MLPDLTVPVLIEPTQWKALGAAYVGTVGTDAAGIVLGEKGTRALGMRCGFGQQRRMGVPDALGLDPADAEIVDAAGRTAAPAPEAVSMQGDQDRRAPVHIVVKPT